MQQERHYALFVHYVLQEGTDFTRKENSEISIKTEYLLKRLIPDLKYLNDLLVCPTADNELTWKGFAFVFLDMGWTDLLKGAMSSMGAVGLGAKIGKAHQAIEEQLKTALGDSNRIRIITADRLLGLLKLLDTVGANKKEYLKWLNGGGKNLRYDGAKAVEGVIRIANIGRNVPVFRFDDDVIFYGQRKYPGDENRENRSNQKVKTVSSILRLCRHYVELSDDPSVNYFFFSGSYDESHSMSDLDNQDISTLLNHYSVRVGQMAILPKASMSQKELESEKAELSVHTTKSFLHSLTNLGGNPYRQVISGAGLCMSDGAILDLPPFSNMRLNVMWIDDHLKYALHHELGHLGLRTPTPHTARVSRALFSQLRHNQGEISYKDVQWHTATYMQRLVLGCVADAWLRAVPGLKNAISPLPASSRETLLEKVPGIYAAEFIQVLPSEWNNYPNPEEKEEFKERLWNVAVQRLNIIVDEWKKEEYRNTFLGLYVAGKRHTKYNEFSSFLSANFRDGLEKVVVELDQNSTYQNVDCNYINLDDLSLDQALKILIDDFLEYFDWVLFWKNFVQSVRFLLNQERASREELQWLVPFESDVGFSNAAIEPTTGKPRLLQVFLCHGSEDKVVVRKLDAQLKQDGMEAWLDVNSLPPGIEWELAIKKAINNCDIVLVCISSESMARRGFIHKEIKMIKGVSDLQPEGVIFSIPVMLDNNVNVPTSLDNFQAVRITNGYDDLDNNDGYQKLLKTLEKKENDLGISWHRKRENRGGGLEF